MWIKTTSIIRLECTADGNPTPTYHWIQKFPSGKSKIRGHEARLVIPNAMFEDNSEMVCQASNYVKNTKRYSNSQPIKLIITGEPIFKTTEEISDVVLKPGEDLR